MQCPYFAACLRSQVRCTYLSSDVCKYINDYTVRVCYEANQQNEGPGFGPSLDNDASQNTQMTAARSVKNPLGVG